MTHGKKVTPADVVGKIFGRLTVVELLPKNGPRRRCLCLCVCGADKEVDLPDLRAGSTLSCGCLRKDVSRKRMTVHGGTAPDRTKAVEKAFNAWVSLRARCNNPKNSRFHAYGGRGITYSPSWEDFSVFLADMGPAPEGYSIERDDNDLPYSRENCHWIPRGRQAQNRQDTIWISYQQQEWCFKRLCEHLGLVYLKIWKRYISREWPLHLALELPDDGNKPVRIR